MVDIVAGRINRVLETLESFRSQWTPAVARQIDLVHRVYNELLIDDDPEAELSVTAEVVLAQAMEKLSDMLQEMAHQHRSTHQMLSKIGRAIDRYFVTDLSTLTKIDKNIDTDPRLHGRVNALITNHLTSTGKFDVADILTKEAQLPASEGLEFNVDDIRHLMEAFQKRDINPALQWLKQNASRDEQLIYDLQKQHFIKLLEDGETMEALQYSRNLSKNPEELMQLLWAAVAKDRKTRYPDLFNPVVWQQLELRLARVMSRSENYLSQILELGIKMVPSLISLRQLMVNRSLESLFQGDELPIEVDVPNATHSVFACPILKAQCTEQNPPMRLTCGHVISREALHKLAQTGRFVAPTNLSPSNAFSHIRLKCPYCPVESSVADAKRVNIGMRLPPSLLCRHPNAPCTKIINVDKVFPDTLSRNLPTNENMNLVNPNVAQGNDKFTWDNLHVHLYLKVPKQFYGLIIALRRLLSTIWVWVFVKYVPEMLKSHSLLQGMRNIIFPRLEGISFLILRSHYLADDGL
ncbi:unnamed protein product [Acanthocheilonema viteae]|uniref:CTLH domain-containing protein n=1 Tax=Acanthocheilonema viteae TaxID=6277 RepID=A0A498SXV4_ACAVI|nr:unnamed protein product [Acanthocheilonema viteae]